MTEQQFRIVLRPGEQYVLTDGQIATVQQISGRGRNRAVKLDVPIKGFPVGEWVPINQVKHHIDPFVE